MTGVKGIIDCFNLFLTNIGQNAGMVFRDMDRLYPLIRIEYQKYYDTTDKCTCGRLEKDRKERKID